MKSLLLLCKAAALGLLLSAVGPNVAAQIYDLNADWSNTQNPNGPWAFYREDSPGSLVLLSDDDLFPWIYEWDVVILGDVLYTARTGIAEFVVPDPAGYLEFGDIFCGQGKGSEENALFVEWTAPKDGSIDVSGEIWNAAPIDNGFKWRLNLVPIDGGPNAFISDGVVGDTSRSNPAEFSSGASGSGALLNIPVLAGDRLQLFFPNSYFSRLGLNVSVAYAPDPDAPIPTILAPPSGYLAAVGEGVSFEGSFVDDDPSGSHTAEWIFSSANQPDVTREGTVSGFAVSDTMEFLEPGIYSVKLAVTDPADKTGESTTGLDDLPAYVVVYDPDGGFVTGGGLVPSFASAIHPDFDEALASLGGWATFGFVSKYQKGAAVPNGQTDFQFHTEHYTGRELNFQSSSYQWLVVAGARAQFKGVGTVNGEGEYGFMVTAIDSQVLGGGDYDRFRIKIWDIGTELVVYDNQRGLGDDAELTDHTVIRRGNIVIRSK